MSPTYSWHEPYKAALLEIEGTKMQERIQTAESAIYERLRVLSEDRAGTAEERQAISYAINGSKGLTQRSKSLARMHNGTVGECTA